MLTVIRCPFCAGMYEVLQPPVSGALLRCPNCRQTFTFGPPTGAERYGAPRNLPQPVAPSTPTPDPFSFPFPGAPVTAPPQASVPGGPRPPAAPVINISIPTITNPNARPVPSAAPPPKK